MTSTHLAPYNNQHRISQASGDYYATAAARADKLQHGARLSGPCAAKEIE